MRKFCFFILILGMTCPDSNGQPTYTSVITYAGIGMPGLVDGSLLTTAQFQNPYGLCSDSLGTIYVADTYNNCIRKIQGINVTTIAGSATPGDVDANGTSARFNHPTGVYFKNSFLYICDNLNNKIKRMDSNGNVTTIAGSGAWSFQDGSAMSAAFKEPKSICVNASNEVFVADYENQCIRKIANGQVTTYAGVGGVQGDQLGSAATALFYRPRDICFDNSGNLYVVDLMNNKVKVVTTTGMVNLLAGSGVQGGGDGTGTGATFDRPCGIDYRTSGDLIVLDAVGAKVRQVLLNGTVSTIAGSGATGYNDGPVATATFNLPQDICFDPAGNIFISDDNNHVIRKLVNMNPKGISEWETQWTLELFPNPTNDKLIVNNAEQFSFHSFRIYSVDGRLLKEIVVDAVSDHYSIDVAGLREGEYFLIGESDQRSFSGKFLIIE